MGWDRGKVTASSADLRRALFQPPAFLDAYDERPDDPTTYDGVPLFDPEDDGTLAEEPTSPTVTHLRWWFGAAAGAAAGGLVAGMITAGVMVGGTALAWSLLGTDTQTHVIASP